MKNFHEATDQDGPAFNYLKTKFLRFSEAKIKEGVFIGPQIRELFKDGNFDQIIQGDEKSAWCSFKHVANNFLGKNNADTYEQLVNNSLQSYPKLGCNMSLQGTRPSL